MPGEGLVAPGVPEADEPAPAGVPWGSLAPSPVVASEPPQGKVLLVGPRLGSSTANAEQLQQEGQQQQAQAGGVTAIAPQPEPAAAPVVHLAPPVHPQLTAAQLDPPTQPLSEVPPAVAPALQPQSAGAGQVAPPVHPEATASAQLLPAAAPPVAPAVHPQAPVLQSPVGADTGTGTGTPGAGQLGQGAAPGEEVPSVAQGMPAPASEAQPPQGEEDPGSSVNGVRGSTSEAVASPQSLAGAPSVALAPPVAAELGSGDILEGKGIDPEAPSKAAEGSGSKGPAGVQPHDASGELSSPTAQTAEAGQPKQEAEKGEQAE